MRGLRMDYKESDSSNVSSEGKPFVGDEVKYHEIIEGAVLKEKVTLTEELNNFKMENMIQHLDVQKPVTKDKTESSKEIKVSSNLEEKAVPTSIWLTYINPQTSAKQIESEFSKYGKVLSAAIKRNGDKCYGVAIMENPHQAQICVDELNLKQFIGYLIKVSLEQPYMAKTKSEEKSWFRKRSHHMDMVKDSKSTSKSHSNREDSYSKSISKRRDDREDSYLKSTSKRYGDREDPYSKSTRKRRGNTEDSCSKSTTKGRGIREELYSKSTSKISGDKSKPTSKRCGDPYSKSTSKRRGNTEDSCAKSTSKGHGNREESYSISTSKRRDHREESYSKSSSKRRGNREEPYSKFSSKRCGNKENSYSKSTSKRRGDRDESKIKVDDEEPNLKKQCELQSNRKSEMSEFQQDKGTNFMKAQFEVKEQRRYYKEDECKKFYENKMKHCLTNTTQKSENILRTMTTDSEMNRHHSSPTADDICWEGHCFDMDILKELYNINDIKCTTIS